MAGSGMIVGGLLAGLGQGLAQESTRRIEMAREDALLKLKRQWQKEDVATAESQQIAKEGRQEARDERARDADGKLKVGLLALAQEYKQQENETDREFKVRMARLDAEIKSGQIDQQAANDIRLAHVRADLDKRNDEASQRLAREIDRNETEVAGTTPEGYIIVKRGDGVLITTKTRMGDGKGGSSGGSISAAQERRSGGASVTPRSSSSAPAATPARSTEFPSSASQVDRQTKATLETEAARLVARGDLGKGERKGQTVTAPAGAFAPYEVTLEWDGTRWVFKQ